MIEIIVQDNRIQVVIIAKDCGRDVVDAVYTMVPSEYRLAFDLQERWKVWAVIAAPDWAAEHRKSAKPEGLRMRLLGVGSGRPSMIPLAD